MSDGDPLIVDLARGHARFLAVVEAIRPDLHRYCARMTGSVTDGEDVVQDVLAKAYYALSQMDTVPELRPWLFRMAHNRALDVVRRYERRMGEPLGEVDERAGVGEPDAEDTLAQREAMGLALYRFTELVPAQRSAVILKDVLGCSLAEMSELLDLSIPAIKAALHRGRTRLRELAEALDEDAAPAPPSPELVRYAALFNARDWDGVRALLAEEVELDLVARARRSGQREVSGYFTNYDKVADWQLVPAHLERREVLAVRSASSDTAPSYFIEVAFEGGRVRKIRDYRYVPYIARDARFAFD